MADEITVQKDCWLCEHMYFLSGEKVRGTTLNMMCEKTSEMCDGVCDDFKLEIFLRTEV